MIIDEVRKALTFLESISWVVWHAVFTVCTVAKGGSVYMYLCVYLQTAEGTLSGI